MPGVVAADRRIGGFHISRAIVRYESGSVLTHFIANADAGVEGSLVPTFKVLLDDGEQLNSSPDTQSETIASALMATMRTAAEVALDEIRDRSEMRSISVRIEDPRTGETAFATVIVATTVAFGRSRRH